MPYVQTDLRIHYRVVGDGPPVVWHTGGCGDGEMWELGGYLDRLPGYTHLLMDHRGRGRSEAPMDMAGHHMSRYVADALAVWTTPVPTERRSWATRSGHAWASPLG